FIIVFRLLSIMNKLLQIHPDDNCLVALGDLVPGEYVFGSSNQIKVVEPIAAKHKVALTDLPAGSIVKQYGVSVGRTTLFVKSGQWLNTSNLAHLADPTSIRDVQYKWNEPDISKFMDRTF